jgi:hypothetical protein
MRRIGIALGAFVIVLAGVAAFVLLRPATEVRASGSEAMIRCDASVMAEDCGTWGDAILADGAPTTTFDVADLERLDLARSLFGFGSSCEAAYFIGRYPDDAVWTEEIACPDE